MTDFILPGIEILTPPAVEPVSYETDLAPHLRLDGEDLKPMVITLATIARQYVEWASGITLIDTVYKQYLDELPSGEEPIGLVRGPAKASGFTLTYTDTAGAPASLIAGTDFIVDNKRKPGEIVPVYGKNWAVARPERNSVILQYTAGYGTTAADIAIKAPGFKLLIQMLVAAWFENPEAVTSVPLYAVPCPAGFTTLLDSVRTWGF